MEISKELLSLQDNFGGFFSYFANTDTFFKQEKLRQNYIIKIQIQSRKHSNSFISQYFAVAVHLLKLLPLEMLKIKHSQQMLVILPTAEKISPALGIVLWKTVFPWIWGRGAMDV